VKSRRRIHEMNDSYFLLMHNYGSQEIVFTYFVRTLLQLP